MEKSKFDELAESLGVIETKKRILYPRQIKFSESFLNALKNEYYAQKLEEDISGEVKNRPVKFLKAMQFHINELEENAAQELEALRRQYAEESTENYNANTEDKLKDKANSKKVNSKKEEKRRNKIADENMGIAERKKCSKGSKKINENILPKGIEQHFAVRLLKFGKRNPQLAQEILDAANMGDVETIKKIKLANIERGMFNSVSDNDKPLRNMLNHLLNALRKGEKINLPNNLDGVEKYVKKNVKPLKGDPYANYSPESRPRLTDPNRPTGHFTYGT